MAVRALGTADAWLTSFGDDMFIGAPGAFGETNALGIVCASPAGNNGCEEDLQISFVSSVMNLMFESFGASQGDNVTVSAFSGATLLGSLVVTTDTSIDFSAFGAIDRLTFIDNSTAAGIGWGDFSFNTNAVPEPGSFALLGLALGGLGFMGRRKRS